MLEFRKYPAPPTVEKDPPMCVVSYPEACDRPAVGEVWSMPFCRKHGEEAPAAARLEAHEDAGRELDRLMGGIEGEHAVKNPLVYEALKGAKFPDDAPTPTTARPYGAPTSCARRTRTPTPSPTATRTPSSATPPTTGGARRAR